MKLQSKLMLGIHTSETMTFKSLTILIVASITFNIEAYQLVGEGHANEFDQAKRNSMADLALSLSAQISSETYSKVDGDGRKVEFHEVSSKSSLPILGADFIVSRTDNGYRSIVTIDSNRSLPVYISEAQRIKRLIKTQYNQISGLSDAQKYNTVNAIKPLIRNFNRLNIVIHALGGKRSTLLDISIADINKQLIQLESEISSIELAADLILADAPEGEIKIFPLMPVGSQQPTQLSRRIHNTLKGKYKAGKENKKTFELRGNYEKVGNYIYLNVGFYDIERKEVLSRTIKLNKKAYGQFSFKAKSINFQNLLHNGYVVDNKFRASISTSIGNSDLLISEGDSIELFIKLNNSGYFYLVSHITNGVSYLFELSEAPGRRKFVKFINADDANKWISLGEFESSPPFGTENIQMIASNIDLIGKLPTYRYNSETELYELKSDSLSNISNTRALKPKKSKKIHSSEATISLTTQAGSPIH